MCVFLTFEMFIFFLVNNGYPHVFTALKQIFSQKNAILFPLFHCTLVLDCWLIKKAIWGWHLLLLNTVMGIFHHFSPLVVLPSLLAATCPPPREQHRLPESRPPTPHRVQSARWVLTEQTGCRGHCFNSHYRDRYWQLGCLCIPASLSLSVSALCGATLQLGHGGGVAF